MPWIDETRLNGGIFEALEYHIEVEGIERRSKEFGFLSSIACCTVNGVPFLKSFLSISQRVLMIIQSSFSYRIIIRFFEEPIEWVWDDRHLDDSCSSAITVPSL